MEEAIEQFRDVSIALEAYALAAVSAALMGSPLARALRLKPGEWVRKSLKDICELRNGHGFSAAEWSTTGLPIIRIQNLNGSREFNYFAGQPNEEWIVEPGTLLYSWAGVKGMSFGPRIWKGPRGVLNQHIYRVLPSPGINLRWLYEVMRVVTTDIERKAHGFKLELVHVRKGDIEGHSIYVPSTKDQQKIAAFAESLAHALESANATVRETVALRCKVLEAICG